MAPSNSSTKKLAKVARSGKKRTIRESSDRTYPLAILAVVLVGSMAVFWGRTVRVSAQEVEPRLQDHWHAAYGLYLCDSFASSPSDAGPDRTGIHSHEDGVIHIHPFTSAATGERATLERFFETVGLDVSDKQVVGPDGKTYESGKTTCGDGGETGKLVLAVWDSADDAAAAPRLVEKDIVKTRFVNDRMAFTLAFVPESKIADIPRPESVPNLDNLSDVPGADAPAPPISLGGTDGDAGSDDPTGTTAAGGATTTTAAGGDPTSTTSG
jgi:hypothetical protein